MIDRRKLFLTAGPELFATPAGAIYVPPCSTPRERIEAAMAEISAALAELARQLGVQTEQNRILLH